MTEEDALAALQSRLAQLEEEDRISEESRGPVTLQQDSVGRLSRMDAMQQQAMALASEKRRQAEKGRIKAALRRIEEHEWGYCLTCGEQIAAARLNNDPSVSQCIGCAGR
ncbi:TraR/DksA C4-type zinc finger protein [Pontixanthobacter aestiaquae]|uniref:TraR/DksA family transcriptional regulator n=1 Tax=Pontixanthobacter aestiaquae TaxID=1509367 RepID=A0A844Z625_9SPHN|nr:TraR/DksA C4-type zinc finger protein [Pontixanthobacter aestiaquae]MDN3646734.1 TraR/DksA C4-type zinc finger protein [Pontixanthobacter aestiaquae]MXO82283.1 TraR/DksA family transcriptional regulator [Pontixanthobacter aestiaquae]